MKAPHLVTRLYHAALGRVPSREIRNPGESPVLEEYRNSVQERANEIIERGLPKPSETISWELERHPEKQAESSENPTFSIATWNIKKGMELEQIIAELNEHGPDIACLQEVDWDCARTGNKNIALEIAEECGYRYMSFSTEFVEVQGDDDVMPYAGKKALEDMHGGGLVGRATLSKYPIKETTCINLTNEAFDWQSLYSPGPRTGQRISQKSAIQIGNREISIYNTHLENFGGMEGRRKQWEQVYQDANGNSEPTIILGDLNTLLSGPILPLHPEYFEPSVYFPSADPRTWGQSEAQRWQKEVFSKLEGRQFQDVHEISAHTCSHIHGVYKAKLDWVLLDPTGLQVENKKLGKFGASDHRPLIQTLRIL
jgi:endonuclease/exonuclease/phosphatase family metal-dependent hydrolase